jgi:hypothetical protein
MKEKKDVGEAKSLFAISKAEGSPKEGYEANLSLHVCGSGESPIKARDEAIGNMIAFIAAELHMGPNDQKAMMKICSRNSMENAVSGENAKEGK